MNSVGLNMFIAVVGISAGPGFVKGLQTQGIGLFLWGSSPPQFRSSWPCSSENTCSGSILLSCSAAARERARRRRALGMICETAKSQVPALGYTVTYAVGNTLLTIWGMVIIILMT